MRAIDFCTRINHTGHLFVVVEGPSAVGKTVTGRLLAEKLDAVYLHCPTAEFESMRKYIHQRSRNVEFLFYLAANVDVSDKAARLLDNCSVVIDRYVFTTLCWYRDEAMSLHIDIAALGLLRPDVLFLLNANHAVRLQRQRQRGLIYEMPDSRSVEKEEDIQRYVDGLRENSPIEIDTSQSSTQNLVDNMLNRCNSYRHL